MKKTTLSFLIVLTSLTLWAELYLDKDGKEDNYGQPLSYWIKNINNFTTGKNIQYINREKVVTDNGDYQVFRENAAKELIKWELQKKLKNSLYFPTEKKESWEMRPLKTEANYAYKEQDNVMFDLLEKIFFDEDLAPPNNLLPFDYSAVKKELIWGRDLNTNPDKTSFLIKNLQNGPYKNQAAQAIGEMKINALLPLLNKATETATPEIKIRLACLILRLSPGNPAATKIIETEVLPKGINKETLPYLTLLPDIKYLKEALNCQQWNNENDYHTSWALNNASFIHKEKVLPILTEHLLNQDIPFSSTKNAAFGQFAQFEERSVPFLVKLMQSDIKEVKTRAISELNKMGVKAKAAIPELKKLLKDSKKREILSVIYNISNDPGLCLKEIINNKLLNDKKEIGYFLFLAKKSENISPEILPQIMKILDNEDLEANLQLLQLAEKHPELSPQIIPIFNKEGKINRSHNSPTTEIIILYLKITKDFDKTFILFHPEMSSRNQIPYFIKAYGQITGNFNQAIDKYYEIEKEYIKHYENKEAAQNQLWRYLAFILTEKNNLKDQTRESLLLAGLKDGYCNSLHPQNYPFLFRLIEDKDPAVRNLALKRFYLENPDLAEMDPEILDQYINFLSKQLQTNTNLNQRINAVNRLARIKQPEAKKKAISILIRTLQDPMDQVANAAQNALEKQGTFAMPQLFQLVKGDNTYLGMTACQIIGGMSVFAKNAVPTLIDVLKNHKDLGMRLAAIEALGNIGPPAKTGIPALKEALSGTNNDLKIPAARALIMLGGIPKGDKTLEEIIASGIVPENSRDRLRFENVIMQGIK